MADKNHSFARDDIFPSYFANRFQEFLAAAHTGLTLSKADATHVQVVPDPVTGIAACAIEGRWRWVESTINRIVSGGAGTLTVWACATDENISNSPDPFTDNTDYAFELRLTTGADPTGFAIFESIGEVDWTGTAIDEIRQTYGAVGASRLPEGLIDSGGDVVATRQPDGGFLLEFAANMATQAELDAAAAGATMFPGAIVATGRSTAPSGFVLCDGASLLRAGPFAALYAAIGSTYGSADGTHFNVPDLRGRVPVGVDGAAGRVGANDTLGAVSGADTHTLSQGEMPVHNHGTDADNITSLLSRNPPAGATAFVLDQAVPPVAAIINNAGGGGAHNNMQPYQVVQYVIKT